MKHYTKLQKFLSYILIFALLFSTSVNISFFGFVQTIFAADATKYNVVSIFVQEEIYDDVKSQVKRYAQDISAVMPNLKTIIIPTSSKQHPADISSLNEKLFFEGYNGLDGLKGNSQLVGSVFVGDIPLPVVENNGSFEKTVLPYVDFQSKLYEYDRTKNKYVLSQNVTSEVKAEIWHGFISPNTGNQSEDIKQLQQYFDKNHAFYEGEGIFQTSKGVMNGSLEPLLNEYEPSVFYFDQLRESQALNLVDYASYKAYLNNIEDISYNRFSKALADALKSNLTSAQSNSLGDVSSLFGGEDMSKYMQGPTTQNIPDIQTRHIINSTTKKFLQIYNGSTIGEMRKDVHNAGRYNSGASVVNMDLIPSIITALDTVSFGVLKDVNTDLESEIDAKVKNGLSRNIAIPTSLELPGTGCQPNEILNILNGKLASSITQAQECSLYRGNAQSGTLVEANRGYNVNLVQSDLALCNQAQTSGYWGGNSPINIDQNSIASGGWKLNSADVNKAIVPVYDIAGANKVQDETKNPSPLQCYNNNFIVTKKYEYKNSGHDNSECSLAYALPVNGAQAVNWSCSSTNENYSFSRNFDDVFANLPISGDTECSTHTITLNGSMVKTKNYTCKKSGDDGESQTSLSYKYNFKSIASYITHTSPNASELSAQVKQLVTPNLPVDKNRYIDFIAADNSYAKIAYPYLFRLKNISTSSLSDVKQSVKSFLDGKSQEINTLIQQKNPSKLSGEAQSIYQLLKTGNYPEANLDLYQVLASKPNKTLSLLGDSKNINYLDTLTFAVYWNNLPSVSAKYKFVMENYLSNQFGGNDFSFGLPKNKKQYEISYLGASGDPVSMYVKMDPEDKSDNPYADIMARNATQSTNSLSVKKQTQTTNTSSSRCAPPEGVPIYQWMGAVTCRLKDMLPPKITINQGNCGVFKWLDESADTTNIPDVDEDKNGLNDVLEKAIQQGAVKLKSDSTKYYFNKQGSLDFSLVDASGSVVSYDNVSKVSFDLVKLVVPKDSQSEFSQQNQKVIYDATSAGITPNNSPAAQSEIEKYITFKSAQLKVTNGKASYNFSTKSSEADVIFRATLTLADSKGKSYVKSVDLPIWIRGDLFYGTSYKLSRSGESLVLDSGLNSVKVSPSVNVFIAEEENFNTLKSNLSALQSYSTSGEKLFVSLANYSKSGQKIPLSYPLVVTIKNTSGENVREPFTVSSLSSPLAIAPLKDRGSYTLEIKDKTNFKIQKEIEVFSDTAVEIVPSLSTQVMEKGGVITTHAYSILDAYKNPTVGDTYTVEMSISGKGVTFEDGSLKTSALVSEGFRPFRLKTTQETGTANIQFVLKKGDVTISTQNKPIQVVDRIEFEVVGDFSQVKVGENTYNYDLKVKKTSEVASFGARAYLVSNGVYFQSNNQYIDIKNNVGYGSFTTKTKAGENIKLEFKVEGVKDSIFKEINILPGKPMRIDLSLSKSKVEASSNATSLLTAVLKDRYSNAVWTDNSTQFQLEILEKYKPIISANTLSQTAQKGKSNFTLKASDIPGTAYFKVSVQPLLEANEEKISDGFTLRGVSANAGKIETFYFWNKQKIQSKQYNSLYTTLLGSNYGDITVKDNLANALIFDSKNSALAVTSLLNSSQAHKDIFSFQNDGKISLAKNSADLSQDITPYFDISKAGDLSISFVNNTFGHLAGKLSFNLKPSNLDLSVCKNSSITSCFSADKTNIVLGSTDSNYQAQLGETLKLLDASGEKVLEVSKAGNFSLSPYVSFAIDSTEAKGLVLQVKLSGKIIAKLGISLVGTSFKVIRDEQNLASVLASQTQGGVVLFLESRDYYFRENYVGVSTGQSSGYTVSYNDPYASTQTTSSFNSYFPYGYENYQSQKGLGWSGDNKTLLSFSAGKSVGEATKDYQTFSLINIGDPVVSLQPLKKTLPGTQKERKFDATVGRLISSDSSNIAYNIFDYNNDDAKDVVILKNSKYIELLQGNNNIQEFSSQGNIAYLSDLGDNKVIETGDFTGDGYDDILLLNKDRKLVLLNNDKKIFSRVELNLGLNGVVGQVVARDMDGDGKTDFVVLDDAGELTIFYGTSTLGAFDKVKVSQSLGVQLNTSARSEGGAVYYKGMSQLKDNSAKYTTDASLLNLSTVSKNTDINESTLDGLFYVLATYNPSDYNYENAQVIKETGLLDLSSYFSGNSTTNVAQKTTFVRSQYANNLGVKVEKNYLDLNGGSVRSGDKVLLNIKLTNTTSQTLSKIAYMDKINDPFALSTNPNFKLVVGNKNLLPENIVVKKSPSNEFDILLDSYKENGVENSLSLAPGESLILTVSLDTKTFKYGYIEVGDFDATTSHGDIIFKTSQTNCGKSYDLFKSTSNRSYTKENKEESCISDAPSSLSKNNIDTDNNGVPDYIDELASGKGNLAEYSQEKLSEMNKDADNDGLPDDEDFSPGSAGGFMNNLDQLNAQVDTITQGMQTILDGLSCGFGGGACISSPMNWAPLAPGNDPVVLGNPVGDGLKVGEGMPIFSAINFMGVGPYCVPAAWPPAAQTPGCGGMGAGGRLGTNSTSNFIRVFVTPTITGAVGTAVCFGAPASIAGKSNPPGIHPFVPGGNCIVIATPKLGCKDDGSDGNISAKGLPNATVINGNCGSVQGPTQLPDLSDIAQDYLTYKTTGVKSESFESKMKESLKQVASPTSSRYKLPTGPLLNIGGEANEDLSIGVDVNAIKNGDFGDVLQIQMERISPFPDFVMEWVTRQVEEIANKLTDFPTLYIVLPDFSGVFDSEYKDFFANLEASYKAGQEKNAQSDAKVDEKIKALEDKIAAECKEDATSYKCVGYQLDIKKLQFQKGSNPKVASGINGVYQFLGSLPMISIDTQVVNISVPFIDSTTLNKAILDYEAVKKQRQAELERAKVEWKIDNYTCVGSATDTNPGCKIVVDLQNLIISLDRNIEVLQEYKKTPEKIHKLLTQKEQYLEQILCNVESISKIMGGWIGTNGKIFKSWIELYILIKAVLKSWQLLVDVFVDYEAECHQCKNERSDLMYYFWKMVSVALPKMPIIQFPKWPDLYLDLHNIRVGITISLPEFNITTRPIILPTLPKIYLPSSPNVQITLPSLPVLPTIDIPTLPELPGLPTVELPNLPPPPKLPKLFSSIEGYLNILKLVTKAMCLLKTSPFVPEWRAGDQIAFMTERTGYLKGMDFLDISMPQFSYPFVDAIKITSYVNLETQTDFLVQMAEQMALPINTFANDITSLFNIGVGDLDFRGATIQDITVDVDAKGNVDSNLIDTQKELNNKIDTTIQNVGDQLKQKLEGYNTKQEKLTLLDMIQLTAYSFAKLHNNMETQSQTMVDVSQFRKALLAELSSVEVHKDTQTQKIAGSLRQALDYSFTKEDALITEMLQNNENKFNEVKMILEEEKQKNQKIMSSLQNISQAPKNILVSASGKSSYNDRLASYNLKTLETASLLMQTDTQKDEIKNSAQEFSQGVKSKMQNLSHTLTQGKDSFEKNISSQTLAYTASTQKLLADTTQTTSTIQSSSTCNLKEQTTYDYKGIYVIEKNITRKISYRLFDYLDELTGFEVSKETDLDNDGDDDMVYMVGNQVFLKENYLTKKAQKYPTSAPIVLDREDNIYLNTSNKYFEGVNGFIESIVDNGTLNIRFSDAKNSASNYRIEFYNVVDSFRQLWSGSLPEKTSQYIIDAFRDIDTITLDKEVASQDGIITRKNLAYIDSVGSLQGVEMTTKELKNILSDINNNSKIIINAGSKLYAGNASVKMNYYLFKEKDSINVKTVMVPKYSHITLPDDIVIVGISDDLYVEGNKTLYLKGNEIISYVKKPLPVGTKIEYKPYEAKNTPYMEIQYFDGSQLGLDFEYARYYELVDLGSRSDNYTIRTNLGNGYYYAKVKTFAQNIFTTFSNTVLLSPQKQADTQSPDLSSLTKLSVPVYQKKKIDITGDIFENTGIKNIKNIMVDFDLEKDNDGDGNPYNDTDFDLRTNNQAFKISLESGKIYVTLGTFEVLMNKKIRLSMVDQNDNVGYKDIDFQVYAPNSKIEALENNTISGVLDESLTGEPINFYRMRGGNITRLQDVNQKNTTLTSDSGKFQFQVANSGSGLSFAYASGSTEKISFFKVDEQTGKIDISSSAKVLYNLGMRVVSSDDKNNEFAYPKIIVTQNNTPIYYQYLVTPNIGTIQKVSTFENISKVGVYYQSGDANYDAYEMPGGIAQNAGDLFVYNKNDASKTPQIALFKDGRIHFKAEGYVLEYSTYGKYVQFIIKKSGSDVPVGKILVIPEENYIIK